MIKTRRRFPIRYGLILFWRFFARYGVVILLFLTLTLLILMQLNKDTRRLVQEIVTEVSAPAIYLLSQPVESISAAYDGIANFFKVYEQNDVLKKKVQSIEELQEVILVLRSENKRLRKMLNVLESREYDYMTTRVLGDVSGLFRNSLLIYNKSKAIQQGQAVLTNSVLLGVVIDATLNTARVRLVTDIESKIPIMTEDSNERAIAVGMNREELVLRYQRQEHEIEIGERVLTSGDANFFRPGMVIGKVSRIDKEGNIYVRPLYDIAQLDFVQVLVPEE